jgi:hypothetical protein
LLSLAGICPQERESPYIIILGLNFIGFASK